MMKSENDLSEGGPATTSPSARSPNSASSDASLRGSEHEDAIPIASSAEAGIASLPAHSLTANKQLAGTSSHEYTTTTTTTDHININASEEAESHNTQLADTSAHKDIMTHINTPASEAAESDDDMDSTPLNEADALKGLTAGIQRQDDLERNITRQANQAMIEQEDERDQKRIDKAKALVAKLKGEERTARERRERVRLNPLQIRRIDADLDRLHDEILAAQDDVQALHNRWDDRHQYDHQIDQEDGGEDASDSHAGKSQRLPNESQRDFLLRTGKITPFSSVARDRFGLNGGLDETLVDIEEEAELPTIGDERGPMSHKNLTLPSFGGNYDTKSRAGTKDDRPRKKRRVGESSKATSPVNEDSAADFHPENVSEDDSEASWQDAAEGGITKKGGNKRKNVTKDSEVVDLSTLDDGNEANYQQRLRGWVKRRTQLRHEFAAEESIDAAEENEDGEEEEWHKPCPDPSTPDHLYSEGVKVPGEIYHSLFDYQRVGVQWLGELFGQNVGGILADEMGLGKTVQVVSFIAGLHFSNKLDDPVIVVAPATVLSQWVKEFHTWWPPLRVSILHSSGSGMLNLNEEKHLEDGRKFDNRYGKAPKKTSAAAKRIADTVVKKGHILVTTYAGLETYKDILTKIKWSYAVLDEGHKIRNPEALITYSAKSLQTPNRVILSGTPMQNNLVELWSLFDFVCPMRLSTLVNFRDEFETPIKVGGYANATTLQVLAAEKYAQTLKDTISPYLMQRLKADVASDLPKKTELVLFCKLTKPQREAYEKTLASPEINAVIDGNRNSLWGIDMLTKICNHPDLVDEHLRTLPGYKWANPNKSGKMQVVKNLLHVWKGQGNKVLLFSQGKLMLNILENFMQKLGYSYLRMDGETTVKKRQPLVDRFNNDPDIYVFLLTTKVGGLGVNLTGANRVIIFDPNWNPSTDMQARERAWRLGQKREVSIFRLMTAGSIEEKIYHRQIYKQFLTNKIFKDPSTRPAFLKKNLLDLFTLGDTTAEGETETGQMFKGAETQFDSSVESTPQPSRAQTPLPPPDFSDITGVASAENFKDGTENQTAEEREARFMSSLFARSGVHSALAHDEIISGKKAENPQIERYADNMARNAADVLRRAGEEARNIPAGQVTWTGHQGTVGRPGAARRTGGPRSSAVISNLSQRQNVTPSNTPSAPAASAPSNSRLQRQVIHNQFVRDLTDFVRVQDSGNGVPTKMIVDRFTRACDTDEKAAVFKEVFSEILVKKEGGPRSATLMMRWVLTRGAASGGGSGSRAAGPSRRS